MENQSSIYLYEPGSLNTTGGVYMEQLVVFINRGSWLTGTWRVSVGSELFVRLLYGLT